MVESLSHNTDHPARFILLAKHLPDLNYTPPQLYVVRLTLVLPEIRYENGSATCRFVPNNSYLVLEQSGVLPQVVQYISQCFTDAINDYNDFSLASVSDTPDTSGGLIDSSQCNTTLSDEELELGLICPIGLQDILLIDEEEVAFSSKDSMRTTIHGQDINVAHTHRDHNSFPPIRPDHNSSLLIRPDHNVSPLIRPDHNVSPLIRPDHNSSPLIRPDHNSSPLIPTPRASSHHDTPLPMTKYFSSLESGNPFRIEKCPHLSSENGPAREATKTEYPIPTEPLDPTNSTAHTNVAKPGDKPQTPNTGKNPQFIDAAAYQSPNPDTVFSSAGDSRDRHTDELSGPDDLTCAELKHAFMLSPGGDRPAGCPIPQLLGSPLGGSGGAGYFDSLTMSLSVSLRCPSGALSPTKRAFLARRQQDDNEDLEYAFRVEPDKVPQFIRRDKKFKYIKVGKVQKFVSLFEEQSGSA